MSEISIGIITVSDSCSEGTATDRSGPRLRELVENKYGKLSAIEQIIVPDEIQQIERTLSYFIDVLNLNVVFTTGGTGFSHRDVTPEATRNVIEKEAPQLALAMALCSLEKTRFAVLSRAVCGIRKQSLIINLPGSKKAVEECFGAIWDIIPHAVQTIVGLTAQIITTHQQLQCPSKSEAAIAAASLASAHTPHVCPHKTGTGSSDDRNSKFPMIEVSAALKLIFDHLTECRTFQSSTSQVNLPPFRASIKDGYAMNSIGGAGIKNVIGYVAAGDPILDIALGNDECVKINTGAAVPTHADAIIQVEDTKLVSSEGDVEKTVEILTKPVKGVDIRQIGSDLSAGSRVFNAQTYPGLVSYKSLLAGVGVAPKSTPHDDAAVCIISTGDELTCPGEPLKPGKIYDSNSTMLVALLNEHGFHKVTSIIAEDKFDSLRKSIENNLDKKFIVCSGGVSMGDKDFLKDVLTHLKFKTHFGRVNMKPGKPMTFATNDKGNCIFGLPGNPVSAFATYHLFVLPALRKYCGYSDAKVNLAVINVELLNDFLELDPRPEYVRARVISKQGKLYAEATGNQISSRLQSIEEADVLLLLPKRTEKNPRVLTGTLLNAYVLKPFFISKYE